MKNLFPLIILALLALFCCCNFNDNIEDVEEVIRTVEYSYYQNGNIATEINFKNKVRDSVYREWLPSGALQVEKYYKDGEEVSGKLFTLEGQIIKNYVFRNGQVYGLLNSSWCQNGLVKSSEKDSMIFNPKSVR